MNPIYIHNTLTGKKELFTPIVPAKVSMYHCGPTVYNYLHIGNLRAYVLADTLRRMFEVNGYIVQQVINITDVGHLTANNDEGLGDDGEDKIEKMAKSSGKTATEIAEYYTQVFFDDIRALNIQTENTIFPKASEHIPEQIRMIEILGQKGFVYKTSDGIYFDTSKYSDYGKLGNINLKGLEEGARIGVNIEKKNITDFALWKLSPTDLDANGKNVEKRFQEWDSPWGVGYPGWHIECSAMSAKYLGDTFDIHTGGIDHIPVHHNNEIAQSECVHNGSPLANYWLHNAFVNSNGKMSKSKGEFTRLQNLTEKGILPVAYRYWLLQAKYSSEVQYTEEAVQASANGYQNLIALISNTAVDTGQIDTIAKDIDTYWHHMISLINDDLNTPGCIAYLWDILRDTSISSSTKLLLVEKTDPILGLQLIINAKEYSEKFLSVDQLPESMQKLLIERKKAREEKNWKQSDEIRDVIQSAGYEILDTDGGQTLKKI